MDNYVSPGNTVTFTAGGTITSGMAVAVGALVGILHDDAVSGEQAVMSCEGIFRVPKIAGAIDIYDVLDFDLSANACGKAITPATGDIEDCFVALEAALTGDTHVMCKIVQSLDLN